VNIVVDDLRGPEIADLLSEHLQDMYRITPAESVHALDIDALRQPDVTFWSAWQGEALLGCGAIKQLDDQHGEIKSMRPARQYLRQRVARALLQHILSEAQTRGYRQVSLETGSMDAFAPARKLYQAAGFSFCSPFSDYLDDPNSVFMTKWLSVA